MAFLHPELKNQNTKSNTKSINSKSIKIEYKHIIIINISSHQLVTSVTVIRIKYSLK